MEVDRRAFLATLGVGTLELMDPEEKAEALEHYMMDMLEKPKTPLLAAEESEELEQQQGSGTRAALATFFSRARNLSSPCRTNPPSSISSDFGFRGATIASRALLTPSRPVSLNAP